VLDAVIKVGGSLSKNVDALRALCSELAKLGSHHKLVVVPGGGEFADVVRELDKRFQLSAALAHRMAVLSMDQYGLMLSNLIPNCRVASSFSVIESLSGSGRVVVLLPSHVVFRARSLEASWDVTSDSIAAYVAARLGVGKLVLVTDVDGVFTLNPKVDVRAELLDVVSASGLRELDVRTSVDRGLPSLLLKYGLGCFVVNGRFPERVGKVLRGELGVFTRILPE
jgi:aspartokinase-like uncharacterized kinase